MLDFVTKMSTLDQTLFYIGFGASIFFVGQLILMFVGGDAEADTGDFGDAGDADGEGDGGDDASSFKILTLKNIIGFLMGLGWGGLALHVDGGFSTTVTMIFAPIIGVLVMLLQATVFWLMLKLHAPNEETMDDAIGNTGKVYLAIPEAGSGKVSVTVNGKISILNAISIDGTPIKTHAQVEVVRVLNNELIVKEVKLVNLNSSAK